MPNKSTGTSHPDRQKEGKEPAFGVSEFLFGRFCPRCADYDRNHARNRHHELLFLIFSLLQRQQKILYRICDGDLTMGLVFCEIWQYNLGRYFARAGTENVAEVLSDELARGNLPACNSYSISQALGAPSETVRRKVQKLIELGWIRRNGHGELIANHSIADLLNPEEREECMRASVSTFRHVLGLLEQGASPTDKA